MLLLHSSLLLRQSLCCAVLQGWRGRKPFIISDLSEDLSFMLLLTSFGEGCNSGSSDPCRVTLVRDGLRRRTMGTVVVVGVSLFVQNFTCSTSGEVEMLVRTMASAYLISPPMAGVKSSSIQVKAVISGWDLFRG